MLSVVDGGLSGLRGSDSTDAAYERMAAEIKRDHLAERVAVLVTFEDRMAALFEEGKIKAPLHLAGGNEEHLIRYFDENVRASDWILCSWRSHYHCLLKGVPEAKLEAAIVAGRSIALCFPQHRILSSAIVGGIAPIAAGLAWSIKRHAGNERVHVFLGDMTAECGVVQEAIKYTRRHALPVSWVVEDNHLSVCTDTQAAWGFIESRPSTIHYYGYTMTRPHVGIDKWVRF